MYSSPQAMEMEQLLSMGFPSELASQALSATGGKSVLKATEWILSQRSTAASTAIATTTATATATATPPPSASNPNPNPSPVQPKLDRFFHFNSKQNSPPAPTPTPTPHYHQHHQAAKDKTPLENTQQQQPPSKRQKLVSQPTCHELLLPLSERMRPQTIDDVIGQESLLGPTSILRSAIHSNRLPSIILWGPPGCGKTSIARAIVNSFSTSSFRFVCLSAVTCGVKDVRDCVEEAKRLRDSSKNNYNFNVSGKRTVLFVDEVHRFNKAQQDSFLPVIEDGSIVFMGATTENPSFHLITPLLSRCRVLNLSPLKPDHLQTILMRAIDDCDKGLGKSVDMGVEVSDDVAQFLCANCDGDARVALNALEISATTALARRNPGGDSSSLTISLDDAKEALQCKHLAYDRDGEEHYNLISALHKSMRGSDADASLYWLARMLEGGEQPLYIARRLIRFASEDVGLADPLALNQAVACYQACHFLGMPECNVILAQCVAYLALATKSIAVYRAMKAAENVVRESVGQNEGVPLHLRNAPTKLMKEFGYGKAYIYTPDDPLPTQSYLPPSIQGYKFLDWPNDNGKMGDETIHQQNKCNQ